MKRLAAVLFAAMIIAGVGLVLTPKDANSWDYLRFLYQWKAFSTGAGGGGGGVCDTTCNTSTQDFSDGDNESFESGSDGSFCTYDWTVSDSDGVINTSDSAQKRCGSYSMSIVGDSDNTGTNNVSVDLGGEDADLYLRFYAMFPNVAAYKAFRFLLFYSSGFDYVVGGVRVRDWGAGEQVYLERSGTIDDEYFAVTAGAWYRLDIHVVGSGGDMTMKITDANGNAVQTSTGGGDVEASLASANYDTQYLRWWDDYDNATAVTIYIDDVAVNLSGSAYIEGCTCP